MLFLDDLNIYNQTCLHLTSDKDQAVFEVATEWVFLSVCPSCPIAVLRSCRLVSLCSQYFEVNSLSSLDSSLFGDTLVSDVKKSLLLSSSNCICFILLDKIWNQIQFVHFYLFFLFWNALNKAIWWYWYIIFKYKFNKTTISLIY